MKDTPGTRIETELDRIRREAFEKEAKALKEAALQHFKDQTSAELNGLRSALKDEMKTAVTAAMSDEAVKKALSKELTDQVLGKVAADIAKQIGDRIEKEVGQAETRVIEKVRKDLLDSWTKAARKALNEGFEQARADFSQDSGHATGFKSLVRSLLPSAEIESLAAAEKTAPQVEGEGPPVMPRPKSGIFRFFESVRNLYRYEKLAVSLLVMVLLFTMYMIWWLLASAPGRPERQTPPKPTPTATPLVETPAPPAELTVTTDRLRTDWTTIVVAAEGRLPKTSPLPELLREHPFHDQFSCWFSAAARKELQRLARGGSPDDVRKQLESAFEACFSQAPSLRDPGLAIFSAQATVMAVFSRYRGEWDSWCANGGEARPLAGFTADGFPGPTTQTDMNLFLTCTGHSAELKIEADSKVPEYLYVTYLALRELQR